MESQLTKDIVFIYFAGNATPLQKRLIEQWLSGSDNVEQYFEWLQEWETSRPQFLPDQAMAFQKFSSLINASEADNAHSYQNEIGEATSRSIFGWAKWAAVFILSLGVTGYLAKDILLNKSYSTAYNQTKKIILGDSSTVVLNPNSLLKIPRWGFGSYTRDVVLEGEAEFVVRHTLDDKPFVVHTTDQNKVTVLGTEFLVYTRNQHTSVILNKGKVQLESRRTSTPRNLQAGDKATISKLGIIQIEKLTREELATPSAWKQHRFNFSHTTLGSAAREMNEIFGVKIVIEDHLLAARELTGTFKAQNADELLAVLSEMLDMKIDLRDNKLYLTPKP